MSVLTETAFRDRSVGLAGLADELGAQFASRAARHDQDGSFVAENYPELKSRRVMSAMIPVELGGGGARHSEMCQFLRRLAWYCPATALALSMHQHLVGTAIWRFRHANGSDALLRKVAAEELVLVSTGAKDWLESSGSLHRVEGGYRFSATKPFASGSPAGDLAITSAPCTDPQQGQIVLHFGVSLHGEGVRLLDDWDTLGMRGTGSQAIVFENVFVPDASITLQRPRGAFHPSWSVVLTVAMPLIMSVYRGVAERACAEALSATRPAPGAGSHAPDEATIFTAGEMQNELAACQLAVDDMIRLANEGDFKPDVHRSSDMLVRKTLAANAAIGAVEKAMELAGGRAFYRKAGIERLLRDVHGAQFHPLSEKPQHRFTGRVLMDLDPIG